MQGFQMLASVDNGWGGFVNKYVDSLVDEFGKKTLWVSALNGPNPSSRVRVFISQYISSSYSHTLGHQTKQASRASNEARSLYALSENASVYIPMSHLPRKTPSYLSMDPHSSWCTTALQLIAYDTLTLPTRLRSSSTQQTSTLEDLSITITPEPNQPIAELEMNFPNMVEMNGWHDADGGISMTGQTTADLQYFPSENNASNNLRQVRTFAELHVSRGRRRVEDDDETDDRDGDRNDDVRVER